MISVTKSSKRCCRLSLHISALADCHSLTHSLLSHPKACTPACAAFHALVASSVRTLSHSKHTLAGLLSLNLGMSIFFGEHGLQTHLPQWRQ